MSVENARCSRGVLCVYLTHLFRSKKAMEPTQRELRDINDKLDSLHKRMDRFYEWAALLQKEFRDMKQRQCFLESYCPMEFTPDNLKERLDKIKGVKTSAGHTA